MLDSEDKNIAFSIYIALSKLVPKVHKQQKFKAAGLIFERSMVEVCMDKAYHTRAVSIFLNIKVWTTQVVTLIIIPLKVKKQNKT